MRAVDNSAWDGNAAMSACSDAACYRAICAGRKSGDPSLRSSWALPHHKAPSSPPNAAGVRAALARLSQTQGLTNAAEARRHLEAHMASIGGSKSADHPTDDLGRGVWPFELRDGGGDGMPTMFGHFAVFNEWTEIDSLFEGRFMEQLDPTSMDRTMAEERDRMRVLFQHGRDPQIGSKPLGPIDVLEAQKNGAYYEVPLLDTSYNRDLLPGLRAKLYGASFRFQVFGENWNKKPEKSGYNPDGLPERTITDVSVREFGAVTFPAYASATAGVRSLTDDFLVSVFGSDPERMHDLIDHITGRSAAQSSGGGDSTATEPSSGEVSPEAQIRDRVLRMEGILK